jgi:hypothetical protein
MIEVSGGADRLDIISPMPRGKRLLFALLSLIPLLAPYELILRVQWSDYRHPLFLFAVIISAGAVALSAFLIYAAVAGLSTRMTLDPASSTFTYSEEAAVLSRRTQVFPLSLVESVHIRTHEWSDGAPSFSLMVKMADGASFVTGSSSSQQDVQHAKALLEGFLGWAQLAERPDSSSGERDTDAGRADWGRSTSR